MSVKAEKRGPAWHEPPMRITARTDSATLVVTINVKDAGRLTPSECSEIRLGIASSVMRAIEDQRYLQVPIPLQIAETAG